MQGFFDGCSATVVEVFVDGSDICTDAGVARLAATVGIADGADVILEVLDGVERVGALDVVAVFVGGGVGRASNLGVTYLVGNVDTALHQLLSRLLVGGIDAAGSDFHVGAVALGEVVVIDFGFFEYGLLLGTDVIDASPRGFECDSLVAQVFCHRHEIDHLCAGVVECVEADIALVGVVGGIEHVLYGVESEESVA